MERSDDFLHESRTGSNWDRRRSWLVAAPSVRTGRLVPEVVPLRAWVVKVIWGGVKPAQVARDGRDQAPSRRDGAIARRLPPHTTSKVLFVDVRRFAGGDGGRVVGHEFAFLRVVVDRSHHGLDLHRSAAGKREGLVVVRAGLVAPASDAVERATDTVGVGEGATVQGHAKDQLGRVHALVGVVGDRARGGDPVLVRVVGLASEEVGVVAGDAVPAP